MEQSSIELVQYGASLVQPREYRSNQFSTPVKGTVHRYTWVHIGTEEQKKEPTRVSRAKNIY